MNGSGGVEILDSGVVSAVENGWRALLGCAQAKIINNQRLEKVLLERVKELEMVQKDLSIRRAINARLEVDIGELEGVEGALDILKAFLSVTSSVAEKSPSGVGQGVLIMPTE